MIYKISGLFYCLLFCFSLFGVEKSLNARTLKELYKTLHQEQAEKELKMLCFLQLKNQKLPYGCYEWLLYKKNISAQTSKLFIQHINEKCLELAPQLKNLPEIKKILKKSHLNPLCKKKIEEQKKIIEYQLRDTSPEQIFLEYFEEDF